MEVQTDFSNCCILFEIQFVNEIITYESTAFDKLLMSKSDEYLFESILNILR